MVVVAFFLIFFSFFFLARSALAICPLCAIAIGTGIGFSRYLGVDDTISGLWIGAIIIALGLWLSSFLTAKKIKIFQKDILSCLFMFLLITTPLYLGKFFGHPLNTIFGLDKLALGIFLGIIIFTLSQFGEKYLKYKNKNRVYFPYQKVAIPILLLLTTSAILSLTIN